ncbi:MAG TPA: polysaccharide biosynthesis tyrosine autokinase [Anaerolineales bacterium]
MELRQYFATIGKWFWLILLSVFIAAGASFFASKATTPLYRTKTTLMVGKITQKPDPNSADIYTGQQLAYTYTQLVRREPVLKGALQALGMPLNWEGLANQVSANIVPQTQLIEINVVDSDPRRAKALADAIAQQLIEQSPAGTSNASNEQVVFIQNQLKDLKAKTEAGQADLARLKQELDAANSARQIQDLQNQVSILDTKISDWQKTYSSLLVTLQGGDVNVLTVMEEASVPSSPISPNTRMNVLLAAVIGLLLAVAGVFVIEYLDDTVKSREDIERAVGTPPLGTIGFIEGENYADKLIVARQPMSPIVEAFRVLRMNLQFSELDAPTQTLMVTSPNPLEGKSLTTSNLAVVLAQSGLRVIIVDADLRRPVVHRIFDLPNRQGLSNAALSGNDSIETFIQTPKIENLRVLTSGPSLPNPAQFLSSGRMKEIIAELKSIADIIVFDSPPCLPVADSTILGTEVDGTILVLAAGRTRTSDALQAADLLRRVHINLIGAVLNRQLSNLGQGSYYGYYNADEDQLQERHKSGPFSAWRKVLSLLPRWQNGKPSLPAAKPAKPDSSK